MPGFKQVKLDITSDPSEFERAAKRVGDSSKQMEQAFERVGSSASGLGDRIGRGGADLGRYRQDLDGVGDGFNDVEDRAMGAGNIINGVNDIMARDDPATFAMGLSDLAAGIRYSVVPSLQDGARGVKGLVEGFKEGTGAGGKFRENMVGAAAGAAALTVGIGMVVSHLQEQAEMERKAKEATRAWSDELRRLDGDEKALIESHVAADEEFTGLRNALVETGTSTSDFASQVRDGTADVDALAAATGASKGETFGLHLEMDKLTSRAEGAATELERQAGAAEGTAEANKRAAEEIRGVSDALAAQVDPAFAVIDANNRLADAHAAISEAQAAANEARDEFGEGSPEHVAALEAVTRARQDEVTAGWSQQQSLRDLAAAMEESGMSVDTIIGRLQAMVGQNGVTQGSVDAVAASLRDVPDQVNAVVTADASQANMVLEGLAGQIRTVRLLAQGITVTAAYQRAEHQSKRPKRAGGTAAMGGIRGADILVGEEGPELVNLPGGSYVYPAHTTASMMRKASAGGGSVVHNWYVQGSILSERDVVRIVRDARARGAFA